MDKDTHEPTREGSEGLPPSRGIEPLGEGYDDLDQELDARLSSSADELRSTSVPVGFVDRVFNASIEARNEAEAPLSFTHGLPRRQPAVLKLVALAACLHLSNVTFAGPPHLTRTSPLLLSFSSHLLSSPRSLLHRLQCGALVPGVVALFSGALGLHSSPF